MIKAFTNRIDMPWVKVIWLLWTWLVPLVILVAIGVKISGQPELLNSLTNMKPLDSYWLVLSIFLLPLNILLESFKWKIILSQMERRSLWACTKIVLGGRSLNVIAPFGLGHAFARFMGSKGRNRIQTIGGIAVDRLSQLIPTFVFGLVSVFYLLNHGFEFSIEPFIFFGALLAITVVIFVLILMFFGSYLRRYGQLITTITLNSFLTIFGASFLRYTVFSIQFLGVLLWLQSDMSIPILLLGISWIFFIKTIIPNVSVLGDLVSREVSAVLFFSLVTPDVGPVIVASFVVWLINIVWPALIGIIFVQEIKRSF